MAVVFAAGFEGQAISVDGGSGGLISISGTSAYSTAQARTGVASIRCNPASGAAGSINANSFSAHYVHWGIYIATMPSVQRSIAGSPGGGDGLYLNTDGTISAKEGGSTLGTSAVALSTGQWYWIGYRTGSYTGVIFQIGNVNQVSGTTVTGGGAIGPSGTEASAIDLYIDDIVVDDAGFLASSKVDIALPISDNTVTGVTDNNGVTTNIWQCVDNTPPAGVASANEAANPKVGMHFPASTTCNYLANLETYTTLGVGASDTVLAVQGIVRQGEDIATGTKNLQNVTALTNPTVGGSSVVAGGDGGAHSAETGVWVTTFGTLTTSPSVTLGTSPTIRTSRTSESRVACVDFMGMLVAWTPAAVAADYIPYTNPMQALLAQ